MQWSDIAPLFRNFSTNYKGRTYAIPLDGDFHIIYYRTDLLKEAGLTPPGTWDEYLAIAKRFHGKDLNGDGTPMALVLKSVPKNLVHRYWVHLSLPFCNLRELHKGYFLTRTR
ncbi:MAG: extracellular solute-binding protein [Nostoc sp.]|uniref:extracellular solute-binding protein n=1 Tax=Nostoc sp. TaxID=1180 RepID=UPI002FFCC030